MRNTAINIRARSEQQELIDQAANLLGRTRSDFMLEAACEKAQGVMLDQVFFRLDAKKFKQFCQTLDAPACSNAGLDRLLALKAPWDHPRSKRKTSRNS